MSAHVLLNLLKELGKRDKMRGLSCIACILSLLRMNVKPRLYAQFAPRCKFTPGCKIAPGSKFATPSVAFICQ